MEMEATKQGKHFVLVHGACHGAWCWYKLKPLLKASGHRVTAADMAVSGINPKSVHDIKSFMDYSEPLIEVMSSLPQEERVVLVGHSLGGLNLGLVMEMFPKRVSVAVFLTAFMPDIVNKPFYVLEQDYTLATTLVRPITSFLKDLSVKLSTNFSSDRYGSVKCVYIVCNEDQGMPVTFQRWMIEKSGLKEVKEIDGADHMAMLSQPHKLCECLLEIVNELN